MFAILIILFVAIPLLELAVLIEVGKSLGVFTTIFFVISTGIAGAYLTRNQGFQIFFRIREQMRQGQFPADSLIEGLLILIGGLTLLTPGFITDTIGFLCLLPPTRTIFREFIKREFRRRMEIQSTKFEPKNNEWRDDFFQH